jgi:hypothetical protein
MTEPTKNNIHVLSLSDYTSPEIIEDKRKGFVAYGKDNNYFQHLISLYNNSPTNNAIINSITELIYGNGLDARDKSSKPDEYAMMVSLFQEEEVRRTTFDLKLEGQGAFQVVYSSGKKKIEKVEHFPIETLRAEIANEDGEIQGYYYCADWAKAKYTDKHKRFPAFGFGTKSELIEIYYIRPYRSGSFYYSSVDYQGCTPYCELESEVANYHINNIKNGFSATHFLSFNNGKPDEATQKIIEQRIIEKWTGSGGAKIVLEFNDSVEQAAKIESLQLSDADKQYQFISDEATNKILRGHRVTSPILVGIKDGAGFGNNAEELKTASMHFDSTVINSFRLLILRAVDEILAFNKVSLKTYFVSLDPWKVESGSEQAQLSAHDTRPILKDELAQKIVSNLEGLGETIFEEDEDFELLDCALVEDESTEFDTESFLNSWIKRQELNEQTLLKKLAVSLGVAENSYQDTDFFKIRYAYRKTSNASVSGKTRPLCNALLSKALMYRKEDIREMSSKGGAEDKGQQYDVFLHKGGANCQHGWERRIYKKKAKKDGTAWGGGALNGVTKAQVYEAIRAGAKVEQAEAKKALTAPRDTPTKGYK